MLQTIEVEIDSSGRIEPIHGGSALPAGRGLLTRLPAGAALAQPDEAVIEPPDGESPLSSLFGIMKASRSVSPTEIKAAVRRRAAQRFNDRD